MRQFVLALCLTLPLTALPLHAEEPAPEDDGPSLMEEGAKLLFRGLMAEMGPALEDMSTALGELEPAMRELLATIDDIRNYEAPRMLENGDILIPRRKDAPPPAFKAPPAGAPPAEIEL